MKRKIHKILGVVLTLVLLGSLTAGMAVPAAAAPEAWTRLPTPAPGVLGSYLMGPVGGVTAGPGPMEKAIDGTIYAYWDIGEGMLGSNLYKSSDDGVTWTRCSAPFPVDDLDAQAIVAIACSTEDAKRVYVTDGTEVYRSLDAGATFTRLVNPGVGANILSMAVGFSGDHFVYVGTTNAGGDDVLVLRDAFGYTWGSTGYAALGGGRNVRALACSPTFSTEAQPQVIAVSEVVVAGGGTVVGEAYVSYQYGGAAWNPMYDNPLEPPGAGSGVNCTQGVATADIAFPSDYVSAWPAMDFFIGITSGTLLSGEGGVYRVVNGTDIHQLGLAPAPAPVDVSSLIVGGPSGACKILAAGPQGVVYHSEDNGINWLFSQKSPAQVTGLTNKYLVADDDYFNNGKALIAVRAGAVLDQASVAQTADFGVSFTDLSMINTNADQIWNMEASPSYASDGTVFIVTTPTAGQDSLWKGSGTPAPNGTYWTRVFTAFPPIPPFNGPTAIVKCSPNYATDNAVFLADTNAGQNMIYWSYNGGTWFIPQTSGLPTPFTGALIVINSTTMIVGDAAGNAVLTGNNGTTWAPIGVTGSTPPIHSFAMSPDGSTLLAGDSGGAVFSSTSGGFSWAPVLPGVATPGGGRLNVAFDADYANNNTIYAADDTSNAVYRVVVGTDTQYWRIDGAAATSWPGASTVGAALNANPFVPGIQATPDGALYVADAAAVAGGLAVGDAFTVIDNAGGDNGVITVTGGAVTITNVVGAPVPAAPITVAAPASVVWASALGETFTVAAAAPGSAGTWTAVGGGFAATAGITNDADGDAFVNVPNIFTPTATWSLPDAAGVAGAAAARAVLRSINPTFPITIPRGVYFESMNTGFTPAAAPAGVWYTAGSNTLFTLESAAGGLSAVWTYTDDLTVGPTLASPADGADSGRTDSAMLMWDALPNCPLYEIWVAPNQDFSPLLPASGFSDTPSYVALGLLPGMTYYWKVVSAASSAGGRALSPWSETWSFTTGIGAAQWSPFADPENVAPTPGATDVPVSPVPFQWNAADWATGYEFVLAATSDFASPMVEETLDTPVYSYTGTLAYSTTYYWKVRAVSATSESVWATGTFTTMAAPVPPPEPTPPVVVEQPAPITPAWIWAIVIIGAILVIAVIVLIVTTRRVP